MSSIWSEGSVFVSGLSQSGVLCKEDMPPFLIEGRYVYRIVLAGLLRALLCLRRPWRIFVGHV
jgi:hypothetical protein